MQDGKACAETERIINENQAKIPYKNDLTVIFYIDQQSTFTLMLFHDVLLMNCSSRLS